MQDAHEVDDDESSDAHSDESGTTGTGASNQDAPRTIEEDNDADDGDDDASQDVWAAAIPDAPAYIQEAADATRIAANVDGTASTTVTDPDAFAELQRMTRVDTTITQLNLSHLTDRASSLLFDIWDLEETHLSTAGRTRLTVLLRGIQKVCAPLQNLPVTTYTIRKAISALLPSDEYCRIRLLPTQAGAAKQRPAGRTDASPVQAQGDVSPVVEDDVVQSPDSETQAPAVLVTQFNLRRKSQASESLPQSSDTLLLLQPKVAILQLLSSAVLDGALLNPDNLDELPEGHPCRGAVWQQASALATRRVMDRRLNPENLPIWVIPLQLYSDETQVSLASGLDGLWLQPLNVTVEFFNSLVGSRLLCLLPKEKSRRTAAFRAAVQQLLTDVWTMRLPTGPTWNELEGFNMQTVLVVPALCRFIGDGPAQDDFLDRTKNRCHM